MAYVKFLDSKKIIPCEVLPQGEHIVRMKFPKDVVANVSGFMVYLDSKGEYDIGGNHYKNFKTMYRNDEETAKYNGYELSNDGSIYVAPPEPEPEPEPTPEEIAERERQEKISELQMQISGLQSQLSETDYIIIKAYEASLVGEILTEYNYDEIHAQRQDLRDRINALELELSVYQNTQEV